MTLLERFENKFVIDPGTRCWNWIAGKDWDGYGHIWVKGKTRKAHRTSYSLFVGRIGTKLVCHKCDNPSCVNPAHLFLGTNEDNIKDCMKKNRKPKGITHGMAKLTETDVLTIRDRVSKGESRQKLAQEYGVLPALISKISLKQLWRHL